MMEVYWRIFYNDDRVLDQQAGEYRLIDREKISRIELYNPEGQVVFGAEMRPESTLIIRRRNRLSTSTKWDTDYTKDYWYIVGFLKAAEGTTQRGEFWIVDSRGRLTLTTKLQDGDETAYPVQLTAEEARDLQKYKET